MMMMMMVCNVNYAMQDVYLVAVTVKFPINHSGMYKCI